MVLWRMCKHRRAGGTGRWSYVELHELYRPQIIEGGRIKRMMWVGHVALMRQTMLVSGID
jgi:hypothetical protein